MLAGLARVANQHAAFQLVEVDAQFDAMFAAGRQFNGRGTTKSRRIVVLRARGNVDDDGFGIAADVNPIDLALPCSGEAVQRGANGHSHGAGAADTGTRGSFGIGHQCEAALGTEELGDLREERKTVALGFHERGETGEGFFTLSVAGHEADGLAAVGFNAAGSVEGDGGVDGDGAGMKQVERPDVECSTGEVHTGWRLRFDNHGYESAWYLDLLDEVV